MLCVSLAGPTNNNTNPPPVVSEVDEVRATNIISIIMTNINSQDANIFDCLPTLAHPKSTSTSAKELNSYLNADIEDVSDLIAWWCGVKVVLS